MAVEDNTQKAKQFALALFNAIDAKYQPTHALKIKIDHNNLNKDLKQKCAAHPYNVLGWTLVNFEKAMVGKKNWKTDHVPFLWIKVAEKEGKYQHGYVVLSGTNTQSDKIQEAIDKAREQLLGTIEVNLLKIRSIADLEIDPSLISYVDADGNAKLRNIVASKTILGI
jgi:hypothetical protein